MTNGNQQAVRVVVSAVAAVLTALLAVYALMISPIETRVNRCERLQDASTLKWEETNRRLGEIQGTLHGMREELRELKR